MRLMRLFKNQNFKIYFMELIIVILGISIAYQLNIVYENRVNHGLEMGAVSNLQKEIQINIEEFESLKSYRKQITGDSRKLMELLKSDNVRKDSIEKYVFRLVRTSTPDLQQQATASYLASNYNMSNLELKNELLQLQTYFLELLDLSEDYKDRKQNDFMRFLRDAVDFPERKVMDLGVVKTVAFKNIIWNQSSDEHELNRLYALANSQLTKVDSLINMILDPNE